LREAFPLEDEQYQIYREVQESFTATPVILQHSWSKHYESEQRIVVGSHTSCQGASETGVTVRLLTKRSKS